MSGYLFGRREEEEGGYLHWLRFSCDRYPEVQRNGIDEQLGRTLHDPSMKGKKFPNFALIDR